MSSPESTVTASAPVTATPDGWSRLAYAEGMALGLRSTS